jgi:mRNA interferase MazF
MKPGDIVLTRFTYSDFSGSKVRPALVLSSEKFNQETKLVIIAAISSRPVKNTYELLIENWESSGLRCKSKVCISKLLTGNKGLLTKIGSLDKKNFKEAISLFYSIFLQV